MMTPLELERFEAKVSPEPNTGCWIWTGASIKAGYGYAVVGGKTVRAHKASFEHFKHKVPDGLCVCHSCDNRWCVNPDHLWLGTHKQNAEDRDRKGRLDFNKCAPGWSNVGKSGTEAPGAKLTPELVRQLRAEYAGRPKKLYRGCAPLSQRGLAAKYGIAQTTCGAILRGEIWRDA